MLRLILKDKGGKQHCLIPFGGSNLGVEIFLKKREHQKRMRWNIICLDNHKLFFTTQLVYIILAQALLTFDKNIPWKCKFSDCSLLKLKFIKHLMSFFKQKVSFSLNFGWLFSVMRDNSSVLFYLKLTMIWTKMIPSKCKISDFRLLT